MNIDIKVDPSLRAELDAAKNETEDKKSTDSEDEVPTELARLNDTSSDTNADEDNDDETLELSPPVFNEDG
jgi:hypothetical protein